MNATVIHPTVERYSMTFACRKCNGMILTHSEIDPNSSPEVADMIQKLIHLTVCNDCATQLEMERKRREGLTRADEWKQICPSEFRATTPDRLPSPSKLEQVMRWKSGNGAKGLILHGPTGRGKSRCAWKLAQREFMAGRGVAVIDCLFTMEYTRRVKADAAMAIEWLEGFMKASLLLLDDAFKVKLANSGSEAALFGIINERTEHRRPMIVTTQDIGDTLAERMSPDRGEAIVRRLREFCDPISFA